MALDVVPRFGIHADGTSYGRKAVAPTVIGLQLLIDET